MQRLNAIILPAAIIAITIAVTSSCSSSRHHHAGQYETYIPASKALYDSIVHMDSIWEDSYNNCKLALQEDLISEDLEFYHDQGGLMTSKKLLIQALERNICGKVVRELLPGSIEVYPIHGYGAVEMGLHRFHAKSEAGQGHYAKFIHLWHNENGHWRITRVISLH